MAGLLTLKLSQELFSAPFLFARDVRATRNRRSPHEWTIGMRRGQFTDIDPKQNEFLLFKLILKSQENDSCWGKWLPMFSGLSLGSLSFVEGLEETMAILGKS